jgi:hypothetical protein
MMVRAMALLAKPLSITKRSPSNLLWP